MFMFKEKEKMDEDHGEKKEYEHDDDDLKVENEDAGAKETTVDTETPVTAAPSRRVAIDAPPTLVAMDAPPTLMMANTAPPPPTLQDIQRDFETPPTPPPSTPPPPGTSKWVLLFLFILLLTAIGMLGYVINYLRDDDNNNNGSRGGSSINPLDGTATTQPSPTLVPSLMPSSTPTSAPTAATFNSIANAPGATLLRQISMCDDCEEQVVLPFRLNWRGEFVIRQITVNSNGYLDFSCEAFGFPCARVGAANGDLNPSVRGDVWIQSSQDAARRRTTKEAYPPLTEQQEAHKHGGRMLEDTSGGDDAVGQDDDAFPDDYMVISWENVAIYGDSETSINAQVTLFANGIIEICWGQAKTRGKSLNSGVSDFRRDEFYPAQGPEFDSNGGARFGWPTNRCQRFFQDTVPVGEFTWISVIPGAVRLDYISSCDDCEEAFQVESPFYWLGRYPAYVFWVSANGRIRVDDCERGRGAGCFMVDVAQADLNPSLNVGGTGIWAYDASDRSIISWEGVPFYGSAGTYIEAQASFFNNGDIEICWGGSMLEEYNRITAGVRDTSTGRYFPASGYPFDSSGTTTAGTWPGYQCQRFSISENETSEPTSYPWYTTYPSQSPNIRTDFPTIPPMPYTGDYTPIYQVFGADRLDIASSCDDCSERIPLPFDSTVELVVSANGYFTVECQASGSSFEQECFRILVAATDLNPGASFNRGIWALDTFFSEIGTGIRRQDPFIISWEGIPFFGADDTHFIEAQAHLFINGTLRLCWGGASVPEYYFISAGIENYLSDEFFPASIRPFESGGQTTPGEWPFYRCQTFDIADTSPTPSPITSPLFPSPTRTPPPTYTPNPTSPPTYDYPSSPPAFDDGTCTPTVGFCASNANLLDRLIVSAMQYDTISICGNFNLSSAISVRQSNITLCCADSHECVLAGYGFDRILYVSGENVTLRSLTFRGGVAGSRGSGGNVAIVGAGHHRIFDCFFFDGFASQYGGNLFVQNATSVHVSGGGFAFGSAIGGGGGASFEDILAVSIEDSIFENNSGSSGGGGVYVTLNHLPFSSSEQVTSFTRTEFVRNSAGYGGGFLQTAIGSMPRLIVDDSIFRANVATYAGGAGCVFHGYDNFIVRLTGNAARGNIDNSDVCDDLALYLGGPDPLCASVDVDLRLPLF